MSLTIKENRSDFIVAPEGLHIARCYALIDLGQQENKHYANYSPKVLIGWELSDVRMKDGRPFVHFQRYTSSLNEKSKLRSLLESWRGKGFTPEELKGFNLKSILGAPCYLTLRHTIHSQTQKKWANVIGICRLPSAVQVPALANPSTPKPIRRMLNSGWRVARKKGGLEGVRVHDLKHTFGRRLRSAGVSFEDRQDLLGHKSARITTHYSSAELINLWRAANTVCNVESTQPAVTLLHCGRGASLTQPTHEKVTNIIFPVTAREGKNALRL